MSAHFYTINFDSSELREWLLEVLYANLPLDSRITNTTNFLVLVSCISLQVIWEESSVRVVGIATVGGKNVALAIAALT